MEKVKVELMDRSYYIYIGEGLLNTVGKLLKEEEIGDEVVIITNPKVGGIYEEKVNRSLREVGIKTWTIEIPDGEEYKTLKVAEYIYNKLIDIHAHRYTILIALGGGVVGDVVGFVAATFMRGIPFIQIPTTLLAQVDSSVGGKTGINLPAAKNMVGAFWQPKIVVIDPEVLKTLSLREFKSGLAEVIKYGMIKDAMFFKYLEQNLENIKKLDMSTMNYIIKRSCEIKAEIVSLDEREAGLRAILNFGHTIGHAIEAQMSYQVFRHGEAVSIGMVCATKISAKIGIFHKKEELVRLIQLLQAIGLPVKFKDLTPEQIWSTIMLDKKRVKTDKVRFILPNRIGYVIIMDDLNEKIVLDILKEQME
jgi:3-dehydroquinate synthase